jgi:hypothetical protein
VKIARPEKKSAPTMCSYLASAELIHDPLLPRHALRVSGGVIPLPLLLFLDVMAKRFTRLSAALLIDFSDLLKSIVSVS